MELKLEFIIVPTKVLADHALNNCEVRILMWLCYFGALKDGGCWPSYQTLSKLSGMHRATVIRAVKSLCSKGYVEKTSDAIRFTNTYRVKFDIKTTTAPRYNTSSKIATPPSSKIATQNYIEDELYKKDIINNIKKERKTNKVTLQKWEEFHGKLVPQMMHTWLKENGITDEKIEPLLHKFRMRMEANGNQYVNFVRAFQVWIMEGYLGVTLDQLKNKQNHGVRL